MGKPEHIMPYLEESFLFDSALYFKDTLVKGIAYKNQKEELLLACLRIVMLGGFCFPPYDRRLSKHRMAQPNKPKNIAQHSSSSFSRRINRTESKIDKHPCEATLLGLTERQYEVLVLLAQGWPLKTVAKKMRLPQQPQRHIPRRFIGAWAQIVVAVRYLLRWKRVQNLEFSGSVPLPRNVVRAPDARVKSRSRLLHELFVFFLDRANKTDHPGFVLCVPLTRGPSVLDSGPQPH